MDEDDYEEDATVSHLKKEVFGKGGQRAGNIGAPGTAIYYCLGRGLCSSNEIKLLQGSRTLGVRGQSAVGLHEQGSDRHAQTDSENLRERKAMATG